MQRVLCGGLLLVAMGIPTTVEGQPADFGTLVEDAMDGFKWGMSHKRVFRLIEERIDEHYRPLIQQTVGAIEQDRVLSQAREDAARVKNDFVVFDGRVSGWDVSNIGPEFRRNSGEAMLVYNDEQSRNHYFFMRGRLWKWYREFSAEAFGGAKFDVVSAALTRRFGDAQPHEGQRIDGGGLSRWFEWEGDRTRITAIDRGTHIVLLFTDLRVQRQLATLRRNALPRRPKRKSTIDAILMTEDEREAFRAREQSARR